MNADRKLIYIFWRKTLLNAPEWNIHNRRGMHNYFYSNCSCGGAFRYIYFRGLINLGQKFNHKSIASGQQSLLAYDGTWVIYNVWLRGAIFFSFLLLSIFSRLECSPRVQVMGSFMGEPMVIFHKNLQTVPVFIFKMDLRGLMR